MGYQTSPGELPCPTLSGVSPVSSLLPPPTPGSRPCSHTYRTDSQLTLGHHMRTSVCSVWQQQISTQGSRTGDRGKSLYRRLSRLPPLGLHTPNYWPPSNTGQREGWCRRPCYLGTWMTPCISI